MDEFSNNFKLEWISRGHVVQSAAQTKDSIRVRIDVLDLVQLTFEYV